METNIWVEGPIELIKHGLKHIQEGEDFDFRIAMISIDNAVETTIKTYLALNRRSLGIAYKKYKHSIRNFPTMLDLINDYASNIVSTDILDVIEIFHIIRNNLYHQGHGITVLLNFVEQYATIAKDLLSRLFEVNIEPYFEDIPVSDLSVNYNEFLMIWRKIEINLKNYALTESLIPLIDKPYTINKILDILIKKQAVPEELGMEIAHMLEIRNKIVHGIKEFKIDEVNICIQKLRVIDENLIQIMNN